MCARRRVPFDDNDDGGYNMSADMPDPHALCARCGHPRARHIDRAGLDAAEPCDETTERA